MVAPKGMISEWLEWLSEWVDEDENGCDIDWLLSGYALAAEQAGFDRELVKRIAAIPSMEPRYGPALEELRSVAAEARRQSAEDRSWQSLEGR